VHLGASTKPHVYNLIQEFLINTAFTMAYPNFKKGLKMVSGPIGVNIHTYTFQIHNNTFQKPYILLTYITIPLLYSNILPYTSIYIETIMRPLYSAPFCLVTNTIFQKCHGASLFYQDVDGLL
jgi:hypothetical protein